MSLHSTFKNHQACSTAKRAEISLDHQNDCTFWGVISMIRNMAAKVKHSKANSQIQLICCLSNISQTNFRGSRGISIKRKGKTGKILHVNAKFCNEHLSLFYFLDIFFFFLRISWAVDKRIWETTNHWCLALQLNEVLYFIELTYIQPNKVIPVYPNRLTTMSTLH